MKLPLNLSIAGNIFHLLDFKSINRTLYSRSIHLDLRYIHREDPNQQNRTLVLKQGVFIFHSTKPKFK
jgi:hypothetical protein